MKRKKKKGKEKRRRSHSSSDQASTISVENPFLLPVEGRQNLGRLEHRGKGKEKRKKKEGGASTFSESCPKQRLYRKEAAATREKRKRKEEGQNLPLEASGSVLHHSRPCS